MSNFTFSHFDWSGVDAKHWQQGRINPQALSRLLNLAIDEQLEWTDFDPHSGDYRVYAIAYTATAEGGSHLSMELHRQGSGFAPRIFPVLEIGCGPVDTQGLAQVAAFQCDAGMRPAEFALCLSWLALTIAALREGKRPHDAWLAPLLSRSATILWEKTLMKGGTV